MHAQSPARSATQAMLVLAFVLPTSRLCNCVTMYCLTRPARAPLLNMGCGTNLMKPVFIAWLIIALGVTKASAEPGPQTMLRKKVTRMIETRSISTPEYDFRTSAAKQPKQVLHWLLKRPPKLIPHTDAPVRDLPILRSKQVIIKALPRPTFSQHASSLAEVEPGELLAAWFGGSWEGRPDVGIWMSRYKNGAWSASPWEVVSPEPDSSVWNPVLFKVPASGETLLFYKVGKDPEYWTGRLKRSYDNGRTWGEFESLPSGVFGPAKNKPVVLADGTILAGSSDEITWTAHAEYSSDNAKTWKKSSPVPFEGKILQPAVFLDASGKPRMLCRSYGERVRKRYVDNNAVLVAADRDGSGFRWGPARRTNLPNPNSGLDVVRLLDGRLLAVYNPNNDGGQRSRASLAIAVSHDDGLMWQMIGQLERIDTAPRPWLWPEFSYPSIIQSVVNGTIHITYTYTHEVQRRGQEGRENIMHAVIDMMDLSIS